MDGSLCFRGWDGQGGRRWAWVKCQERTHWGAGHTARPGLVEEKGKERAGELSGKETMLVQGGIWVTGECTQWLEAPMGQTLGLS